MGAEQKKTLETELHLREAHPYFVYAQVEGVPGDEHLTQPPDTREGWEPNPAWNSQVGYLREDGIVVYYASHLDTVGTETRYWRRRKSLPKVSGYLRISQLNDQAIVNAAVGNEIHPDFEYWRSNHNYAPVPVDSSKSVDEIMAASVRVANLNNPSGWAINDHHPTGGYTITRVGAHLHLYRSKSRNQAHG